MLITEFASLQIKNKFGVALIIGRLLGHLGMGFEIFIIVYCFAAVRTDSFCDMMRPIASSHAVRHRHAIHQHALKMTATITLSVPVWSIASAGVMKTVRFMVTAVNSAIHALPVAGSPIFHKHDRETGERHTVQKQHGQCPVRTDGENL